MPIRKEDSGRKKILFTLLVGFVLVSSIIGFTLSAIPFGLQGDNEDLKYNGIEFFQLQNGIATRIDGQIIDFIYFPSELTDVETGNITAVLKSARVIYATSDPGSALAPAISGAEFDIGRVLEAKQDSFLNPVFTAANVYNMSIITCNDANPFVPVLYFNFTNTTTGVSEERSCVTINVASESALNKIRDRVIYELLGVIE